MTIKRPYVLTIAGHDPSAGAGVLADIKTMEQCGVYGLGVTTAITYQNENEFDGVKWLSFEEIEKQLKPMLRKYTIKVAKIGLIENLEVLEKTISLLTTHYSLLKIIWDPILSASAGFVFHNEFDLKRLRRVLNSIYLITPNQPEYDKLLLEKMDLENTNLLLKGGHREEHVDVLFENQVLRNKKQEPRNKSQESRIKSQDLRPYIISGNGKHLSAKHGSGCVLSSAIAAYLALGNDLVASCELAKEYVEKLLESNEGLLGYHTNL